MPTALNFTGRKPIDRTKISIVIRPLDKEWTFDAKFDPSSLGAFPPFAQIWLEAHRDNLWMHWPWGTIENPKAPEDRRLLEFDVPDGIWFRLKIVQPPGHEHNKLLGEAERIPFVQAGEEENKKRPLLIPIPMELGNQLWRVDLEQEEPVLHVNQDCRPSWVDAAKNPHFISLVYPQAMRMILERALVGDNAWSGDDDPDSWQSRWVQFAQILGAPDDVPDRHDREGRLAWIDEAVELFAADHKLLNVWNSTVDPEGGE
jgi:hypothetical protein